MASDEDGDVAATRDIVVSSENIHKTYLLGVEGVPALRGVSVDVYRGELLVIYGTSGGGKSTLLNVLGTIDVPTKGNLALFGGRVTDRTPDAALAAIRNKKVGFVFQAFNLLSTMNAVDNVALPMVIAGERTAADIQERAKALLRQVGLGHRLTHFPDQLSGGEQQRVTIARALANDPELLLLDEPTGDLDTRNTHLVLSILMELNRRQGLTMAMVTHDVYMKAYASRILYLRDGRVSRIEECDPAARDAAIADLNATVARENAEAAARAAGHDVGAVAKTTSEVRRPSDYGTYSPVAREKAARIHEGAALFAELFPADGGVKETSIPPSVVTGGGTAAGRRAGDRASGTEMARR